ncbi:MAG: GyrI-like domain-containing protein [Deferribacteres bacterium]|nr:GyrI-like domain-containing protein [candidate division KSB1 bacterium]MCB9504378.1 GyrI-like domain-containing protein [Deferribacteres bacterium]
MEKFDFKKTLKEFYDPSPKQVSEANLPAINYLMVDGVGNPNTSKEFMDATEALYSMAYTLKFMCKKPPISKDFVVMPLEGLWWMENMTEFTLENKDQWQWTLMIMQPDFVTTELIAEARDQVKAKKAPVALQKLRFEKYSEGRCAQIIYVGPYSDEHPTIQLIHDFIKEKGGKLQGKHHEIYLSDPRKTAPEKLKTVLRQPFA